MSDNDSFAGSDSDNDSDNESIYSDTEIIKKTNKLIGGVKPIKVHNSDEDEESIVGSDLDEDECEFNARGADEREDCKNDDDEPSEEIEEENINYVKNIVINNSASLAEEDEDDDEDNETYLQKFNTQVNKNYIIDFHPECLINNYEEITALTKIIKDSGGNIIDNLHRTIPFLTKYEKARVLGQRAKQINTGAKVFIKVPEGIIDGYIIANVELVQKRLPFIIRRPIAGGGCEYWNLKDLENITF